MAADLHIHILTLDITKGVLEDFFSNTFGSKHWNPRPARDNRFWEAYKKIADTPNVRVGEVSWLKAVVLENPERFVPQPIQEINDIIGEDLPVIDDLLIEKVRNALRAPNETSYTVNDSDPIILFLNEHKGQKCFCVSW